MSGLNKFLREFAKRTIWLFCPNRCPYCNKLIGYHDTECDACAKKLAGSVIQKLPMGGSCIAPFEYSGAVRRAILKFKFREDISPADSLAKHIYGVTKDIAGNTDAVTNVPLSALSLEKRGYDQTRILAKKTAELLGLPFYPALKKIKQKKVQHTLDREARKENVIGCYEVPDSESIAGKRLLLIDDICTSGYTMAECRRVLLEAGARDVQCAAAAIAELEPH